MKNKIKVYYDNQIYEIQKFGGISRYFNELKKNDKVEVIVKEDGKGYKIIKSKNKNSKSVVFGLKFLLNSILGLRGKKIEFDIVHPTYYDVELSEDFKKPMVLTVHDMIHEIFPAYYGENDNTCFQKKRLCERADAIIAVSETTKRDLIQILKVPENKVSVIYHGCSFHKLSPFKPQYNVPGKYIFYVGLRNRYKNFDFFLKSVSELLLQNTDLNLVCSGPPLTKEESFNLKLLQLSEKIFHIPVQGDRELLWLYQNAICLVFPSRYEGFGMPILEAFAANCPVVCSTTDSLTEVAGDAAEYFSADISSEIYDAVYKIISDGKRRKELIEKGKIRYQDFSWQKCRQQTLKVYESVINQLNESLNN